MIGLTDRTTTANITGTFAALGVNPPKAVTAAYKQAEKVTDKANHLGAQTGTLEAAVTAAILADRDVHSDPDVQAAVTAQALAGYVTLPDAVTAAAHDKIREACLTHLDSIVGAWSPAFDRAAVTLAAAHVRIGDVLLEDTVSILAKGGDIADVWAQAQEADRTIDLIIGGWTSLMQLVRVQLNPDQRPLKLADLTAAQLGSLPPKVKPWDLVRAGVTLSLPTLDEYRARIARLQQGQHAERQAAVPVDADREATKAWAKRVQDARSEVVPA